MCKAIFECRKDFSVVIGNGARTRIMEDRWLKGDPISLKNGVSISSMNLRNVEDLMN